jgi:hypothetical protein
MLTKDFVRFTGARPRRRLTSVATVVFPPKGGF